MGYRPTGVGSVCFRPAEGGAFAAAESEIQALLDADDGPKVEIVRRRRRLHLAGVPARRDATWPGLVTDLHAVNTTLQDRGFGPSLLCSLVAFADASGAPLGLVYLYKRGTFYPFAPRGRDQRDSALELQVRGVLGQDLTVEPELNRWFAVWGAPGL